jgi:hypothetical protein
MVLRVCVLMFLLLAPLGALAGGPAVSGPNVKFSIEGGQYDDEESFLALGSYTMPLGTAFGLQADGAIGSIDDEIMGGGGLHLFARDPSSYLIGVYGSYHTWESIDIWRAAGEFEFYLDKISLTGLAGYEGIDFPSTRNGLLVLNSDDDHFFGRVDLAYYLTDDFKVSGGYRYESEASLGTASAEYLFRDAGVPMSLFARGDWGDEEFNRVTGGVKVYLGSDLKKTLIKRHRTEDPQNYTPVFPKLRTATHNQCEGGESITIEAPPETPRDTPQPDDSEFDARAGCECPGSWLVIAQATRPTDDSPGYIILWRGTCGREQGPRPN